MNEDDSGDFYELDSGDSDSNLQTTSACLTTFVSPFRRYRNESCSESEIEELDTGKSPAISVHSTRKYTQNRSKAQKRLHLEEIELSDDNGLQTLEAEEAETAKGKKRKKYSPKKAKRKLSSSSEEDFRIPDHHLRKQGKSRVIPVTQLANVVCCAATCLTMISLATMQTCRETFITKTKYAQRQWILDYFTQHHSLNEYDLYEYMYAVGTGVVCVNAWRLVHGITERRFFNIKRKFQEGIRQLPTPNSHKKDKNNTEIQESMAWLEYYAIKFGDKLPYLGEEKYHLPSCLTKKDVYQLLQDDFKISGRTPCCESYFYQLWKKKFGKKIAIPKENRFAKCDFCTKIKLKLENQSLSKEKRVYYMQRRERHLKLQNEERMKYYKHCEKARRYPHKYMCMILDGMDQNKTNIPHFHRLAKSTSQMWNLRTHVTGVILHGIMSLGYIDIGQWPHDSNLTINILLNSLLQVKDRLPKTLYIQMDNCYRENKNKWVFAFCCYLVEKKIFDKVKVNFLMVGHTHEDIDQLFSRFSNWLSKHSAITLPKLMLGFENCYTPQPVAMELKQMFDVRQWLNPFVNKAFGHSAHHCFRFMRDDKGKAVMSTKHWSGDSEWMPCVTGEGCSKYLLMEMPGGQPELVKPDTEDLNLPRLRSSVSGVEQFMTQDERTWWRTWLDDIEMRQYEDEEISESVWYMDEIIEAVNDRPSLNYRMDDAIDTNFEPSDLDDDFAVIPPVHLGKPPSRKKAAKKDEELRPLVGHICCVDTEKYADFWPQIGEIKSVQDDKVELIWYKGAKTTIWRPWIIQQGKQRKPWVELIKIEDIQITNIKLTPSGKLSQETLRNMEEIERRY